MTACGGNLNAGGAWTVLARCLLTEILSGRRHQGAGDDCFGVRMNWFVSFVRAMRIPTKELETNTSLQLEVLV